MSGSPRSRSTTSGCQVAASDAGSLPEVCGDAAVLVDARDPAAIAEGTSRAIERGTELQLRGLEQARSFTWARCAVAHEDAYLAAARRR